MRIPSTATIIIPSTRWRVSGPRRRDLVKLGLALSRSYRRGSFLRKAIARRMLTPVTDDYGLGMMNYRGDSGYLDGSNAGFLTEWWFSLRGNLCVASMINRSDDAILWPHCWISLELFQTVEEDAVGMPGERTLRSYCGKYEQKLEDFRLDEIYLEGGKLYARILGEDGEKTSRLYPIGKKTFGRIGAFAKIEFGDGCLTVDGVICKKF